MSTNTLSDQEIKRLYQNGLSCAAVARQAGMSHGGMHKRLQRLGENLRKRCQHPSAISTEKMVDLYQSGIAVKDIAGLAGFSLSAVARRLKRVGVTIIRKDYQREDLTNRHFGKLIAVKQVSTSGKSQWSCQCDCGKMTIVPAYQLKSGNTKSCGCSRQLRGVRHPRWRGGKYTNDGGYVIVAVPPEKIGQSQHLLEHRIVMDKTLGRRLFDHEQVHHKNGVRSDNRLENLELKVKAHGSGISTADAVIWATEILRRYNPQSLA